MSKVSNVTIGTMLSPFKRLDYILNSILLDYYY